MEYTYQAKDESGQVIVGRIDAPNEDFAVSLIQQKNLFVLEVKPVPQGLFDSDLMSWFNRPNNKDLVIFTRQLATLIEADVPLLEGLNILSRQVQKVSWKRIITTTATSIEGGATLSVALAEHEKIFGKFYISLVRVGEVSGKMQDALLYLADYLERSAALTQKLRGALFYPGFVLSAMVLVTVIMMTTVIPQLLKVIADSGVTELPLPTRILVAVTGVVNHYFLLFIVAIVALAVFFVKYGQTERGRYRINRFQINAPIFGRIVKNFYIARIAETLATLLKSGVPILDGLEITSDVVGNAVYEGILLDAKKNVEGGGTFSEVAAGREEFPILVSSMLATGEKTGRTVYMLETILKFYKTEAENDIANLSQIIEPVLILVLGIGIGSLVAAILLPIYSLISATG